MKIITTINDLKNQIDTWDADGDLTAEQRERAARAISARAHIEGGLAYGEDWEDFLAENVSFEDVLEYAAA